MDVELPPSATSVASATSAATARPTRRKVQYPCTTGYWLYLGFPAKEGPAGFRDVQLIVANTRQLKFLNRLLRRVCTIFSASDGNTTRPPEYCPTLIPAAGVQALRFHALCRGIKDEIVIIDNPSAEAAFAKHLGRVMSLVEKIEDKTTNAIRAANAEAKTPNDRCDADIEDGRKSMHLYIDGSWPSVVDLCVSWPKDFADALQAVRNHNANVAADKQAPVWEDTDIHPHAFFEEEMAHDGEDPVDYFAMGPIKPRTKAAQAKAETLRIKKMQRTLSQSIEFFHAQKEGYADADASPPKRKRGAGSADE